MAEVIDEAIVATCDTAISDAVARCGGRAVMTAPTHERCTDRVAEAARSLDAEIIVNVQGDEPLVRPEMFAPLLEPLFQDSALLCTNLMAEIRTEAEFASPNVVKVVVDCRGNALYYSREPIPSVRKAGSLVARRYKQLGIIAFRRAFLTAFAKMEPTPLEAIESVDMLRAIEHGHAIRMVFSPHEVVGVDTPADLERVRMLMSHDDLLPAYSGGSVGQPA
jgi:3-deoxy-manno-octulosonate cytidylyltransferase (CMP-KDO synthetase)